MIHNWMWMANAGWIRQNADRMQRVPFDGIAVHPYLLDENGQPHYTVYQVMGTERYDLETFRPVL